MVTIIAKELFTTNTFGRRNAGGIGKNVVSQWEIFFFSGLTQGTEVNPVALLYASGCLIQMKFELVVTGAGVDSGGLCTLGALGGADIFVGDEGRLRGANNANAAVAALDDDLHVTGQSRLMHGSG